MNDFKDRPELHTPFELCDAISKKFIKTSLQPPYKGDQNFLRVIGKLACFLYHYSITQNKNVKFIGDILRPYHLSTDEIHSGMNDMKKTDYYNNFKKATAKMEIVWDKMDLVLFLVEEIVNLIKTQVGSKGKMSVQDLRCQLLALEFDDMFIIYFLWNNIV